MLDRSRFERGWPARMKAFELPLSSLVSSSSLFFFFPAPPTTHFTHALRPGLNGRATRWDPPGGSRATIGHWGSRIRLEARRQESAHVQDYTAAMPDTVRVRLRWRDGRIDTWPDAVDATADVVQILGRDGRYHGFVDSGEIDDEGFVLLDEEPAGD